MTLLSVNLTTEVRMIAVLISIMAGLKKMQSAGVTFIQFLDDNVSYHLVSSLDRYVVFCMIIIDLNYFTHI
jgi:hypothetical protein